MDYRKLEYFLAVMEHRNFARAASAMGVSQPAITQNIAKLEKELEVRLFERGLYGAVPTDFATSLETRAKLILSETRGAAREIKALKEASKGELRMGVGLGFAGSFIPRVITKFQRRWPKVVLSCVVGNSAELLPMVVKGDLDFALSAPPQEFVIDADLQTEPMFRLHDEICMAASHPLARQAHLTAAMLRDTPWAVSRGIGLWKHICGFFAENGLDPPEKLLNTSSVELARQLVISCGHVAMLGEEIISRELEVGTIVARVVPGLGQTRFAYLTQRKRGTVRTVAKNMMMLIRKASRETYGQLPNPRVAVPRAAS